MRVRRIVLQQLASAEAVLTPDEKDLGVAVIDIGGGTTDIASFLKKSIRYTSVLPVGGDHFTRDLAVGLRTPLEDAERIKKEFGTVLADQIAEDEFLEIPGIGTRSPRRIPRKVACQYLRDRAMEVLDLVKAEIARSGMRDYLTAGVVLTGGGSMLNDLLPLAEEILELPVRQGLPQGILGLTDELSHPVYATAIGLAIYGTREEGDLKVVAGKTNSASWFPNRFLSWVSSLFL
jgi:cell division protein FtsA